MKQIARHRIHTPEQGCAALLVAIRRQCVLDAANKLRLGRLRYDGHHFLALDTEQAKMRQLRHEMKSMGITWGEAEDAILREGALHEDRPTHRERWWIGRVLERLMD